MLPGIVKLFGTHVFYYLLSVLYGGLLLLTGLENNCWKGAFRHDLLVWWQLTWNVCDLSDFFFNALVNFLTVSFIHKCVTGTQESRQQS